MPAGRRVEITVDQPPGRVYDYVTDPTRLPEWAAGLGTDVRQVGSKWYLTMAGEQVEVEFAPRNVMGIADHDVTFPDGRRFHNPLRISPDGTGSRVTFTVSRDPGMDDAAFERDCAAVAKDLACLKRILEG